MLPATIRTSALLVVVSTLIVCPAPLDALASRSQGGKQRAWAEIISRHKAGVEALAQEKAAPNEPSKKRAREQVFGDVAWKLSTYIRTYITETGSVTYLREIYRLAIYLELAGFRHSASLQYVECLKHPLINRGDSVFDGKRIAALARERFLAVTGDQGSSMRVVSRLETFPGRK
jgi:hypothetical protein